MLYLFLIGAFWFCATTNAKAETVKRFVLSGQTETQAEPFKVKPSSSPALVPSVQIHRLQKGSVIGGAGVKPKDSVGAVSGASNQWASLSGVMTLQLSREDHQERSHGNGTASQRQRQADWQRPKHLSSVGQLLALIAFAEAPHAGYNSVHRSAKIGPKLAPTKMTLAEIRAWVDATPGQAHAIGRYQFIPSTMADLITRLGLEMNAQFTPGLQDKMARRLLRDAGLETFQNGALSLSGFADRLAGIWAGLPLASGLSAYDGIAGNKATVTRAFLITQLQAIFERKT